MERPIGLLRKLKTVELWRLVLVVEQFVLNPQKVAIERLTYAEIAEVTSSEVLSWTRRFVERGI